SLQLLRFQKGKRVAPQIQRTRSDDLLASVFPQVAACQENVEGDIQIPDHPLVREVMKDVLGEAMDLEGLKLVLAGMDSGAIRCLAVDTTTPSQFAHELLNANPNAFLDDAPLEERRARAVNMRGMVPDSLLGEAGRLDPAAIAEVRDQIWPDLRDDHELHDHLCALVVVPIETLDNPRNPDWQYCFSRLVTQGRATIGSIDGREFAVAAERVQHLQTLWPGVTFAPATSCAPINLTRADAIKKALQGWLAISGPTSARTLAADLNLDPAEVWQALLLLEMTGTILRGIFESSPTPAQVPDPHSDPDVEWCERRILQRIHKRTLGTLRKQIEPVTPAVYMQWLLRWQHLAPRTQLTGEAGLLEALRSLEGFEAPALEWERSLLPQRVAGYDPRWLDSLCMSGVVGWGRISPHPAFNSIDSGGPRRVIPTSMAPITFFIREEALWMDLCLEQRQIPEPTLNACLSELASRLRSCLADHGAMFSGDLIRALAVPATDASRALWELVAAGLVTADGFHCLRALIDPRAKIVTTSPIKARTARHTSASGRWCLLGSHAASKEIAPLACTEQAARHEAQLESACWILLRRYGILFRDLLDREQTAPRWRDLAAMMRRMEARGELRGGRFLSGFGGEQFALPEAVESLREMRREKPSATPTEITVAAADPLNLVGIVIPGERVASVPGKSVTYTNGTVIVTNVAPTNGVVTDVANSSNRFVILTVSEGSDLSIVTNAEPALNQPSGNDPASNPGKSGSNLHPPMLPLLPLLSPQPSAREGSSGV
ncbi:MAG TPA: hypothetical protein VGD64_08070, partial [Acidisarcina sp.]